MIRYIEKVSQSNETYYQDIVEDMTTIDETKLRQKYSVGKAIHTDLQQLMSDCGYYSKKTFFS